MEQISRSANQKDDDMTEFDYNQMYAKLNPLTDNQAHFLLLDNYNNHNPF